MAQDQLFATEPAPGEVRVDKTFRTCDQDQTFLMPPSLRDWLPDHHLALYVCKLVEDALNQPQFLAHLHGITASVDRPRTS